MSKESCPVTYGTRCRGRRASIPHSASVTARAIVVAMDNVSFVPLDNRLAAVVEQWVAPTALDTLLKRSEPMPLNDPQAASQGWVAVRGGQPIAVATVHPGGDRSGYLDIYVKPSERRQGIGGAILAYVLEQPTLKNFGTLQAAVAFDNTAGQKILSRHGFMNTGYTEDNRIRFERR